MRAISIFQAAAAMAPGQLVHQNIAKEGLVVAQPAQPPGGVIKAFLIAGFKPLGAQGIAHFGE